FRRVLFRSKRDGGDDGTLGGFVMAADGSGGGTLELRAGSPGSEAGAASGSSRVGVGGRPLDLANASSAGSSPPSKEAGSSASLPKSSSSPTDMGGSAGSSS